MMTHRCGNLTGQVVTCLALTASVFALASTGASAGTIRNLGTSDPVSPFLSQFDHSAITSTARAQRNGGSEDIFGQTFYAPSTAKLTHLALKTVSAKDWTGLTSSQLQIKIFDMDSGSDDPETGLPDSDNTLLHTSSYALATLSYGADEWIRFALDAPVTLSGGQLYGFLVFFDSADADNTFDVFHSGTLLDQIAGTMRRASGAYNAGSWTSATPFSSVSPDGSSRDLAFALFQVPEPSTGLLLSLGLVALRRRRKGQA